MIRAALLVVVTASCCTVHTVDSSPRLDPDAAKARPDPDAGRATADPDAAPTSSGGVPASNSRDGASAAAAGSSGGVPSSNARDASSGGVPASTTHASAVFDRILVKPKDANAEPDAVKALVEKQLGVHVVLARRTALHWVLITLEAGPTPRGPNEQRAAVEALKGVDAFEHVEGDRLMKVQ